MQYKIIFVVSLVIIFACELWGLWYFLNYCHKGRMIDTIIAALIIVAYFVFMVIFAKIFDHYFCIF